jgi:hypothetical protein
VSSEHLNGLIARTIDDVLGESTARLGSVYVFDFDDTLVHTDGVIYLVDATGCRSAKSTHEFHEHTLGPGESWDLSAFANSDDITPLPLFRLFLKLYRTLGPQHLAICSARSVGAPIQRFLETQGIEGVTVGTVGDEEIVSSPEVKKETARRKASWIQAFVSKRPWVDKVFFWDDCRTNQRAIARLGKRIHPVIVRAYLVDFT